MAFDDVEGGRTNRGAEDSPCMPQRGRGGCEKSGGSASCMTSIDRAPRTVRRQWRRRWISRRVGLRQRSPVHPHWASRAHEKGQSKSGLMRVVGG